MIECPFCQKELPGEECSDCGAMIPLNSRYCMDCGTRFTEKNGNAMNDDELDFENRVLCADGTCTGIIIDGKCTECGKQEK